MSKFGAKEKLWGGRFKDAPSTLLEKFSASLHTDIRLAKADVNGSLAHAEMLFRQNILNKAEWASIENGLKDIYKEIEEGTFPYRASLEDIHMNIETRLTEKIGDAGKKLHTGRSRNDQVSLDVHLWLRDSLDRILLATRTLQGTFLKLAKRDERQPFPGYTHLQRAQPIRLAHHWLAYFEMLDRDIERFCEVRTRVNRSPLGAGALAGSPLPLDRKFIADHLCFDSIYENSLDAVSDRDYQIEAVSACSILAMHLSKLSEEIIFWASHECRFIELDDRYSTGSSLMPQKKNPDIAELVRGKCSRVYGDLVTLLTLTKGLPLAYNRDLQEDKGPLFSAIDTVEACLEILPPFLETLRFHHDRILESLTSDYSNATDLADYLVNKGLAFRDAHHFAGKCVQIALQKKTLLLELRLEVFQEISPLFQSDVFDYLNWENGIDRRNTLGGTGKDAIRAALTRAQIRFDRKVLPIAPRVLS